MATQAKKTKTSTAIGIRIGESLKKKGLSNGDFAKIMEIDASTISNWKAGRAAFPADQLVRIAKKLGVSPSWLLIGDGKA